jgi:hypothetical protein
LEKIARRKYAIDFASKKSKRGCVTTPSNLHTFKARSGHHTAARNFRRRSLQAPAPKINPVKAIIEFGSGTEEIEPSYEARMFDPPSD